MRLCRNGLHDLDAQDPNWKPAPSKSWARCEKCYRANDSRKKKKRYENDPAFRERVLVRTYWGMSGVEYQAQLLRRRRNKFLQRKREREALREVA